MLLSESMSKVSLNNLLAFISGAEDIPPLGFPKPLTIDFYDMVDRQHFPTASTCDLRLWLPRGIEPAVLQQLVEEAVLGAHGFGKW